MTRSVLTSANCSVQGSELHAPKENTFFSSCGADPPRVGADRGCIRRVRGSVVSAPAQLPERPGVYGLPPRVECPPGHIRSAPCPPSVHILFALLHRPDRTTRSTRDTDPESTRANDENTSARLAPSSLTPGSELRGVRFAPTVLMCNRRTNAAHVKSTAPRLVSRTVSAPRSGRSRATRTAGAAPRSSARRCTRCTAHPGAASRSPGGTTRPDRIRGAPRSA